MSAVDQGQNNVVERRSRESMTDISDKQNGIRNKVFGVLSYRPPVRVMVAVAGSVAVLLGAGWYFAPGDFRAESSVAPTSLASKQSISETFRIREQLRQEDRQDDFQDMLRYWDQTKRQRKSEASVHYDVVLPDENGSETFRIREQLRQEDHQDDFKDMLHYWDLIRQQ